MALSVITVECENCGHKFSGHLEKDMPIAGVEYYAECPKCKKVTSFSNVAGWMNEKNSTDAGVTIHRK